MRRQYQILSACRANAALDKKFAALVTGAANQGDFDGYGCLDAKGRAASAGRLGVGVVKYEPFAVQPAGVFERGSG